MPSVQSLLAALDERTIARLIGIANDEARMRYSLRSNTVGTFTEFSDRLGDYYNYHFTTCVSRGRAKQILEQEYRRLGGDLVTSYNDAHDGTNGGLRGVLDKIAEAIKVESVERYTREVFDRHVAPNAWEDKVEIIRQFIRQCGAHLGSSIRADQPERYAHDYQELIRSYVAALRRTSTMFRRL